MKKRTLLAGSLFCLSLISHAQFSKGATFIGGSFNFSTGNDKTVTTNTTEKSSGTGWNLRPQIGKAIDNKRIIGVFLNVGASKNEGVPGNPPVTKMDTKNVGGGVFYRNYFTLNPRFFLFGESALGISHDKDERRADDKLYSKIGSTAVFLSVVPGISFAATKKLHLETSMTNLFGLSYYKSKAEYFDFVSGSVTQTSTSKRFNASANTSGFSNIAIGLRWILPSKR